MSGEITWLGVTKDQIAEQLRSRFSVDEISIPRLADTFSNLDPILRDEFKVFWQTGTVTSRTSVRGYNANRVIEDKSIEPIGAYTMLNWLIQDPEAAENALKHRWSRYSPT